MAENAEEWLATEDPTNGDLPVTDFMGSTKDLSQSVDPEETDGNEIEDIVDQVVPVDAETEEGAHVEGEIALDVDNGEGAFEGVHIEGDVTADKEASE